MVVSCQKAKRNSYAISSVASLRVPTRHFGEIYIQVGIRELKRNSQFWGIDKVRSQVAAFPALSEEGKDRDPTVTNGFWSVPCRHFECTISDLNPRLSPGLVGRLKLAILAGASSLAVIFAIGYLVQNLEVPRREDLTGLHLFWLAFVAGPLAGATLLGVLLSGGKILTSVSRLRTIVFIAVTPLIALFTFLVACLVFTALYAGHYKPSVIYSMLAVCNGVVVVNVRWFANAIYRPKQSMAGVPQ